MRTPLPLVSWLLPYMGSRNKPRASLTLAVRDCLLDAYTVSECPLCAHPLITQSPAGADQVLVQLRNEGGVQRNLDILPILTEEGYLKAFPAERKARAFLEFCREGDVEAIIGVVMNSYSGASEEDDVDVLRYQDGLGDMSSGLHVAVQNDQEEVAWCLLLLASKLDLGRFPKQYLLAAEQFGFSSQNRLPEPDIRSLQDAAGRTAVDIAQEKGSIWSKWTNEGLLNP